MGLAAGVAVGSAPAAGVAGEAEVVASEAAAEAGVAAGTNYEFICVEYKTNRLLSRQLRQPASGRRVLQKTARNRHLRLVNDCGWWMISTRMVTHLY